MAHTKKFPLIVALPALLALACSANVPEQEAVGSVKSPVASSSPPADGPPPRADGPRPEHHGRRRPPSTEQLLERFDDNGDGKLQLSELPERMQEKFGDADTNKDGVLTTDELKAGFEAHQAARFKSKDTNGDGMLDQSELGDRFEKMKVADTNGDGKLTRAEIEEGIRSGKLEPPHHGRRGKRGKHHDGPPPAAAPGQAPAL